MFVSTVLVAISTVVFYCSLLPAVHGVKPQFRTFEDYLQHLDKNLQSSIVQMGKESSVSTTTLTTVKVAKKSSLTTSNAISNHLSEIEKQNLTCCVLGELAGDKGFHCYAEFYAARVLLRNFNRAHTKKMGFHGRFKIAGYGERLMKTFEQCVAGHGQIFHKCCHLATLERNVSKSQQRRLKS